MNGYNLESINLVKHGVTAQGEHNTKLVGVTSNKNKVYIKDKAGGVIEKIGELNKTYSDLI